MWFLNLSVLFVMLFFFSSRRRHTRCLSDWSSDVCSSDLVRLETALRVVGRPDLEAIEPQHPGERVDRSEIVVDHEHRAEGRSEERRVGKECRLRWARYG